MTLEQYHEYVDLHGTTPTQDPPYNHGAGNPESRPTVDAIEERCRAEESIDRHAFDNLKRP
jgi:hypothetical protein